MLAKITNILRLFTFNLPKEYKIDRDYKIYSFLLFIFFIILGNMIKFFAPNYISPGNFFFFIASIGLILKYLFHNIIIFVVFYYLCNLFSLLINYQNAKLLFVLSIGFNSFLFLVGIIISVFISTLSQYSINDVFMYGITLDGTINFNDSSVKIISIFSILSSAFVGYSAKFISTISFTKVILIFFLSTLISNTIFSLIGYSLREMLGKMS
jgi:hypothetical protein